MQLKPLFAATLLLAVFGGAPLSVAGVFTNGGFETPNTATYTIYSVGGGPSPWIFTVKGGLLSDATGYLGPAASEGNQYMELNVPAGPGTMQQIFDVLANHNYRLDFDLSGVADGTADPFNVNILVTGGLTSSYGYNTGAALGFTVPPWTAETYSFLTGPAQTSATLTVASTVASSSGLYYGPAVDNFRLTDLGAAVPEPSTFVVSAGLGLVSLGFGALRKNHRRAGNSAAV